MTATMTAMAHSKNIKTQRKAAVAFYEASQANPVAIVAEDALEIILYLAKSSDHEVQKMISGTMSMYNVVVSICIIL